MLATDAFTQGAAVYAQIRREENLFREAFLSSEASLAAGTLGGGRPVPATRRCPIHSHYPLLLGTAFPFLERQKLVELCRVERLYAEHLLALDRALDTGERLNPLDLLMSCLRQAESLLGLYGWFPPGHPFWADFSERASRTWRAVFLERLKHFHRLAAYSLDEYETTARDKTALLAIFDLAPTYLSGQEDVRECLSRSLDEHHKGLVFLDDLQDWREDYSRFHYSYPVTRALLEHGLEGSLQAGARPTLAKVGRLLYGTGIAEEQLSLAEGCFRRAEEGLEKSALPLWMALNQRYAALCVSLREGVEHFRLGKTGSSRGASRRAAAACSKVCAEKDPPPLLEVQEGIPDSAVQAAYRGLLLCRHLLRESDALSVTLGRWDGMPAHFHVLEGRRVWVGIQSHEPGDSPNGKTERPLETETVLACVRAQRILRLGRERTLLEACFVAGLALGAGLLLRESEEPWRLVAASALEWQWCQKNEWVLWEKLERSPHRRASGSAEVNRSLDPFPELCAPAPRHGFFYLALRVFEEASRSAVASDPGWMLETWKTSDIRSALGLPRGGESDEG